MAKTVKSTQPTPLTTESSQRPSKKTTASKPRTKPAAAQLQQLQKEIQATVDAMARLETQEWNRAKRGYKQAQEEEYQAHIKYTYTVELHYAQLRAQEDALQALEARRELQANCGEHKLAKVKQTVQQRTSLKEDIENYKTYSEQMSQLRRQEQQRIAAVKRASQREFLECVNHSKQRKNSEDTQFRRALVADQTAQCQAELRVAKTQHKTHLDKLHKVQALLKTGF